MPYPKRLIEVDLPIKRISAHARREKSIRHGHISTLHIWWARRPLAACRSVICAALWPDPADADCPKSFITTAETLMREWSTHERQALLSAESRPRFESLRRSPNRPISPIQLRSLLLDFIADFANWDNSTVREYLDTSRALTQAAHEALGGAPGTRPLVVDPFCGGGSIPLEALRVGADAFASDLNPVPVLLNKVVLEYIPRYAKTESRIPKSETNPKSEIRSLKSEILDLKSAAPAVGRVDGKTGDLVLHGLAEAVRYWGNWIKQQAEKELAEFYPCLPAGRPKTPESATPDKFYVYVLRCSDGSLYKGQTDNLVRRFKQHCNGEVEWTKAHLPIDLIHFEEFDTREESVEREKWLKSGVGREWLASKFPNETPIAYLWARTIQCEGPGCGAEVPLIRSLWLAKKANRSVALQLVVKDAKDLKVPLAQARLPAGRQVDFQIIVKQRGGWVDQDDPKTKIEDPKFDGTVKRGSATCPCCGYTTPVARIREQLKERRGGTTDAKLLAIVSSRSEEQGRFYRLPAQADLRAVQKACEELQRRKKAHSGSLSLVPSEEISLNEIRRISVPIYGMTTWGDLFSSRQLLLLSTLARAVGRVADGHTGNLESGLRTAVQTILACAVDREAEHSTGLCRWNATGQKLQATFGRQAIPMLWDFCETNVFGGSVGAWDNIMECALIPFETATALASQGHVERASATEHPLPSDAAQALVTDPPYYDAVPYAYLSDFFYVWLRRSLGAVHGDLLSQPLVPKEAEIVVDRPHELSTSTKDIAFYERELTKAFSEGRRVLQPSGIAVIVFASKTTASWEAILQAVINAGFTISGSWPVDTELENRLAAQGQARLASSVHLVCRPRDLPAGRQGNPDGSVRTDLPDRQAGEVGDWRDVLAELPRRIHDWMPRLAEEGVVGADAIFACLGPALEVFSRYSRVEKASGEAVPLKEYLEQVWAAVAKEALTMIFTGADATGFEEDARLTAMWLWTLKTEDGTTDDTDDTDEEAGEEEGGKGKGRAKGGFVLEFDAARKIAQGLGAHLEDLTSLVAVEGETARLLPVAERSAYLIGRDVSKLATAKTRKPRGQQLEMGQVIREADVASGKDPDAASIEGRIEKHGQTVLDRVHQSMILFAASRSEALKRFLVEDGAGNDQRFWRLAQALSALYPASADEKRWVDGVLARKKGLGF